MWRIIGNNAIKLCNLNNLPHFREYLNEYGKIKLLQELIPRGKETRFSSKI